MFRTLNKDSIYVNQSINQSIKQSINQSNFPKGELVAEDSKTVMLLVLYTKKKCIYIF
jgi:hypothetical protein